MIKTQQHTAAITIAGRPGISSLYEMASVLQPLQNVPSNFVELLPRYLRKPHEAYSSLLDDFVVETMNDVRGVMKNWHDVMQKMLRIAPPGSLAAEWQDFLLQKLPMNRAGLETLGPSRPDPLSPWRGEGAIALVSNCVHSSAPLRIIE
eukprot:7253916-Pyramimonas_sp.AAC.1